MKYRVCDDNDELSVLHSLSLFNNSFCGAFNIVDFVADCGDDGVVADVDNEDVDEDESVEYAFNVALFVFNGADVIVFDDVIGAFMCDPVNKFKFSLISLNIKSFCFVPLSIIEFSFKFNVICNAHHNEVRILDVKNANSFIAFANKIISVKK